MKNIFLKLKPYLRWFILGAIFYFLSTALKKQWPQVTAIEISQQGWMCVGLGLTCTLLAQTWAGIVWGWILREFNPKTDLGWAALTFLKTNVAKYLPGNLWHLYGRIIAAQKLGFSGGEATLSVILEALLMAASAILMGGLFAHSQNWGVQVAILLVVTAGVHPRILSPIAQLLCKIKAKAFRDSSSDVCHIQRYPIRPWVGELIFLVFRGSGFFWIISALTTVSLNQIPYIISAFSFAWLCGLVIPGAPGGIGVFETAALAMLGPHFPPGIILSAVALYRVISILAEGSGAGLAWLIANQIERQST